MKKVLPRRKLLIAVYVAATLTVVLILTALYFALRPAKEAYHAGDDVEGITRNLSRDIPEDYPQVYFRDVTADAGIDFVHFQGRRLTQLPEDMGSGAAWGDYDGDGDLDLYICGYVQYKYNPSDLDKATAQYNATVPFTLNPSSHSPHSNLLLRNDNGKFVDVASKQGVDNLQGRSLSAAWCDLDEDGWPELYVANDISDNVLYKNLGGKSFQDVSHSAWVADYRGAMGLALADWDNDRDIDIFITHWIAQENAHFGLGSIDQVNRVEVLYPCGEKTVVENVSANQIVIVRKGTS